MKVKLAIIGPCTLRDAFTIDDDIKNDFEVTRFIQSNSPLGWWGKKLSEITGVSYSYDDFKATPRSWYNWFQIDAKEVCVREYLEQKKFDLLLISPIECIYNLFLISNGDDKRYITSTQGVRNNHIFSRKKINFEIINPLMLKYDDIKKYLSSYCNFLNSDAIQSVPIIFYKFFPVNKYIKDNGLKLFLSPDEYQKQLDLLNYVYNFVENNVNNLNIIDIDTGTSSDPNQKWGAGPMHYCPHVYKNILHKTYEFCITNEIKNDVVTRPMINRKKLAVVLFTDNNYLFACGTFLINLLEKIPQADAFIVYYYDIKYELIEKICKIDSRIKFVNYPPEDFIDEYFSGDFKVLNLPFVKRFTHLALSKFKVFLLLDEFEQVVFFDTDMLLTDNIDSLLSKKEYNIIWKSDKTSVLYKINLIKYDTEKSRLDIKDYDTYDNIDTPNGGFFIINNNFDYQKAYDLSIQFLMRSCKYHPCAIDEILLAYVSYILNLKILDVDPQIYNVLPENFNTNAKLLHFMKQFKPWSHKYVQLIYNKWIENYNKFREYTNISSRHVVYYNEIGNVLFANMRYDFYNQVVKSNIFPEKLKVSTELKNASLRLYYNNHIWFSITKLYMGPACVIHFVVLKTYVVENDIFYRSFEEFIINNKDYENVSNDEAYILRTKKIDVSNVQYIFDKLYEDTYLFRRWPAANMLLSVSKKAIIKTYFNKYLCINRSKLMQTIDINMAYNLTAYVNDNKIAFKYSDTDMFIQRISDKGSISLDTNIFFFEFYIVDNNTYIKINNKFLSARNDDNGSVSLVSHNREWERFIVCYI